MICFLQHLCSAEEATCWMCSWDRDGRYYGRDNRWYDRDDRRGW